MSVGFVFLASLPETGTCTSAVEPLSVVPVPAHSLTLCTCWYPSCAGEGGSDMVGGGCVDDIANAGEGGESWSVELIIGAKSGFEPGGAVSRVNVLRLLALALLLSCADSDDKSEHEGDAQRGEFAADDNWDDVQTFGAFLLRKKSIFSRNSSICWAFGVETDVAPLLINLARQRRWTSLDTRLIKRSALRSSADCSPPTDTT